MEIFIIRDGQQTGPFSEDAVQAMLAGDQLRWEDACWHRALPSWMPLSEVLKPRPASAVESPEPDDVTRPASTNGARQDAAPITAKQKVFLKFLGAEFDEDITKEKAAVAISEALENPKLQNRIRKWHDEKLRLHPEVFQDEIDFRKANRAVRYIELCQTQGAEVVQDLTKAHVQVLVESLDKRYPNWEAEPHAALWDYLFPAIGEHFPKLVRPAWKGRLRLGGTSKVAAAAAGVHAGRQPSGAMLTSPSAPSVFAAIARGIFYGVVALGIIIGGKFAWEKWQSGAFGPALTNPPATAASAKPEAETFDLPAPAVSTAPPAENAAVAGQPPDKTSAPEPEKPPSAPIVTPPPAPPTLNPEPAAPAQTPPMAENKPPASDDKAAMSPAPAPPAPNPEEKPAPTTGQPEPPPATAPAQATARTSVNLLRGIGVNLPNGQVTLPAGTPLEFLALEGENVRVGWKGSVFFVPAVATDVANNPPPAPAAMPAPPAPPAAPAPPPAAPGTKPAGKPGDDL